MNNWIVYIHRNKINDKAYIGITSQTTNQRWRNGKGYHKDSQVFARAIKKYGWDNFEHIIWAEHLSEDEAKRAERLLIALFNTKCDAKDSRGYNMTEGGEGTTGFVPSEETREIWRAQRLGKKASDEVRQKLSDAQKKRFEDKSNHPMYGKHHSDEARAKMSESRTGKPLSEERCRAISARLQGHSTSDETKQKISVANSGANNTRSYTVFCPQLNATYGSTREADRLTGICYKRIQRAIKLNVPAGKHPDTGEDLYWVKIEK